MSNINLLLANASGSLDPLREVIQSAFKKSKKQVVDDLKLNSVDVVCLDMPYMTIPELGVAGYTPNKNLVYLYIDSSVSVKEKDIFATLIHEMHHAKRWDNPGYGESLGEALITEGLACKYEEEVTGEVPIYAQSDTNTKKLLDSLNLEDQQYNHQEVFIHGNNKLPRWFGYSAGYWLVAELKGVGKIESASECVQSEVSIEEIYSLIGKA